MDRPWHSKSIVAALQGAPIGHTVHDVATVDSTQNLARDLALAGARPGTLVVAEAQTAGRGTHGRVWLAEPGGALLLSLVLRRPPADIGLTWLTVAGGVAVAEAVHEACSVAVELTWPNDVTLDGRKLAGVLTESVAGTGLAVVGIGLNLIMPRGPLPPHSVPPAALSDVMSSPPDRDAIVIALAQRLGFWYLRMQAGDVAALRERWRTLLGSLGQQVSLAVGSDMVIGTAVDVDERGAIVIATADGQRHAYVTGRLRELRSTAATAT